MNETFAELGEKAKNKMSHRAKAFLKARRIIENLA
jgi:inosine/xanthosine triphosphate pyrophosphatase family protein